MTEVKQDLLLTYRGWGQLIQTNSNDDEIALTFPLNETRTYSLSNSENSDLKLPADVQGILLVHVNKNGKIEIENASTPSSSVAIILNENELKMNERTALAEKMIIKIDKVLFTYHRLETPGSSYLKNLFESLQCAICLEFLDNPQSLSCQHVFCQRCIKEMVSDADVSTGAGTGQTPCSVNSSSVPCPVCRKSLTVSEVKSARPQKILFDVTKQFKDMIDGRPMCAMCLNQRWIMHGSDYFFCETCQKVLCPLCALELHREHKLRSMLETMLQSSHDYIDKSAPTTQNWNKITKQVEDNKSNIKKTIIWLDLLKEHLKKMEQSMDASLKLWSNALDRVQSLEQPQMGDKVETNRAKALENFVDQLKVAHQTIPQVTLNLNAKLRVINQARKDIEVLTAKEVDSKIVSA